MMASSIEQRLSHSLRSILNNLRNAASIPDSAQFREILSDLELFLPGLVLSEIYPDWRVESLDGIMPVLARKTRRGEAEIFGVCIILSDQSVTPIHVRLQVDTYNDEVSWLECRLGERGKHGMERTPYDCSSRVAKRLHAMNGKPDLIDWVYKATFGQRRP
jgi:hypothetical protein